MRGGGPEERNIGGREVGDASEVSSLWRFDTLGLCLLLVLPSSLGEELNLVKYRACSFSCSFLPLRYLLAHSEEVPLLCSSGGRVPSPSYHHLLPEKACPDQMFLVTR